jgi:DMSO reductase family type II enzyme chaperone
MDAPIAPLTNPAPHASSPRSTARRDNAGSVARHRAMLYAILAQGLSAPTEALCLALNDDMFGATLAHALGGAPGAHRRLIDPALMAALPHATTMEALLVEYTRLFASDLICAHYEADYVAGGSFRLAHVLADVSSIYAAFGVRVSDVAHERADHIVIELDFMNFLAAKEAHAARQGESAKARLCRRAQKLFFQRHLGRWARAFAGQFAAAARLDFYQRLRRLLEALMLAEAEYLGASLADIEGKDDIKAQGADGGGDPVCGHCGGHS